MVILMGSLHRSRHKSVIIPSSPRRNRQKVARRITSLAPILVR